MTQSNSRTARGVAILTVCVALAVIASAAGAGLAPGSVLAPHDDDPPAETDDYDDPIVDYDAVDYELTLNNTVEDELNYSLTIRGAVEPVDAAEDTVDCADQVCDVEGTLDPDENASYHVSGAVVEVQPEDGLVGHVNGTFEGEALAGVGAGALTADEVNGTEDDDGETDTDSDDDAETVDAVDDDDPSDGDLSDDDPSDGEDLDCDDFETWEEANDEFDEDDDEHNLDADNDGIPCENLPGAPDDDGDNGDNETNGEIAEITYEDCSTVTIDGEGEHTIEINTEFYGADGITTLTYGDVVTLPETIDVSDIDEGAVTDIVIEQTSVLDEEGDIAADRPNPDFDECFDEAGQQYEDWQDEQDDGNESDADGDDTDADGEDSNDDTDEGDADADGEEESVDEDDADNAGAIDGGGEDSSDDGSDGDESTEEEEEGDSSGDEEDESSDVGSGGDSAEETDGNASA